MACKACTQFRQLAGRLSGELETERGKVAALESKLRLCLDLMQQGGGIRPPSASVSTQTETPATAASVALPADNSKESFTPADSSTPSGPRPPTPPCAAHPPSPADSLQSPIPTRGRPRTAPGQQTRSYADIHNARVARQRSASPTPRKQAGSPRPRARTPGPRQAADFVSPGCSPPAFRTPSRGARPTRPSPFTGGSSFLGWSAATEDQHRTGVGKSPVSTKGPVRSLLRSQTPSSASSCSMDAGRSESVEAATPPSSRPRSVVRGSGQRLDAEVHPARPLDVSSMSDLSFGTGDEGSPPEWGGATARARAANQARRQGVLDKVAAQLAQLQATVIKPLLDAKVDTRAIL